MPLVKNIEKRIWDCEGFDVIIQDQNGRNIHGNRSGLPMYPCERAARKSMTVAQWKRDRFNKYYPGFLVAVLDGNGDEITQDNTQLQTVRNSYEEE